ncbi:YebC/PmpR family DNA-binding transcriptional regulator [Patescibacteria group bacterium]|nr:YebC/PmpR family DNA-binding transcriptional regulator [Patescibacteria group bacterium]
MSGHSKWAGIKHKKALVDAKRGNSFTKLGNTITVAAKQGGGDITMNPSLRLAVEKARQANMPKDNIERAIKRGTGELGGAAVEEVLYEGFGPGNVAVLVEVLTDNRNRSNADVRTIFNKNGGRIAEGGGVAYLFNSRGVIRFDLPAEQVASFEEAVIESGAEDYNLGEEYATVYTAPLDLHRIKEELERLGYSVTSAKIERVATLPIEASDDDLEKVARLVEALDENDDVTNVYTNLIE